MLFSANIFVKDIRQLEHSQCVTTRKFMGESAGKSLKTA